jgi:hypothetical protein
MRCTRPQLFGHIERKFSDFMTHSNRGAWKVNYDLPPHPVDGSRQCGHWHIDHIVPKKAFDLSEDSKGRAVCPADRAICEWYRNLQPIWASKNMQKADTYTNQDKQDLIKEWTFYNI